MILSHLSYFTGLCLYLFAQGHNDSVAQELNPWPPLIHSRLLNHQSENSRPFGSSLFPLFCQLGSSNPGWACPRPPAGCSHRAVRVRGPVLQPRVCFLSWRAASPLGAGLRGGLHQLGAVLQPHRLAVLSPPVGFAMHCGLYSPV